MMFKKNDRPHFFKYLSIEGAVRTLEDRKTLWRNPTSFNDPFDMDFDLASEMSPEEMLTLVRSRILSTIEGVAPPPKFLSAERALELEQLRPLLKDRISELKGVMEKVDLSSVKIPSPQNTVELIDDVFVFCLSEVNDSILMWSHYASQHTGAVLQFKCLKDKDNVFCAATPVQYSVRIPPYGSRDEWTNYINEGQAIDSEKVFYEVATTKHTDWAYEREWRVIVPMKEKKGLPSVTIPFQTEELGAVYFGCRTSDADKKRLQHILSSSFPKAEMYQAEKRKDSFAITFRRI